MAGRDEKALMHMAFKDNVALLMRAERKEVLDMALFEGHVHNWGAEREESMAGSGEKNRGKCAKHSGKGCSA
jgi:hypothetical protein